MGRCVLWTIARIGTVRAVIFVKRRKRRDAETVGATRGSRAKRGNRRESHNCSVLIHPPVLGPSLRTPENRPLIFVREEKDHHETPLTTAYRRRCVRSRSRAVISVTSNILYQLPGKEERREGGREGSVPTHADTL